MKKIVLAIYHDCNTEERSMELLKACSSIAHVDYVSFATPKVVTNTSTHLIDKRSPLALFAFLSKAYKTIITVIPDLIVLHDNDCAPLLPYIRRRLPNTPIVYDSSELYIPLEGDRHHYNLSNGAIIMMKEILSSFRRKYEKKHLKLANFVMAANIERAQIMKDYFQLKTQPYVFDNIHRIDNEYDEEQCNKKFGSIFSKGKFNILFGGGISEGRLTFDYIEAFCKLGKEFQLVIAGTTTVKAKEKYDNIIKGLNIQNIHYLGFVSRAEFRYCIRKSHASVVVFDKKSYNNMYCASGKLYESLFEGIPILASENPPLKRLCDQYKIGVSDDVFDRGIRTLKQDYSQYCHSVIKYIEDIDYAHRFDRLCEVLQKWI